MTDNVYQLHRFRVFIHELGNRYLAGTANSLDDARALVDRLCVEGVGDWDVADIEDSNGNKVGGAYHGRPITEQIPMREQVLKRPGMYFGEMDSGDAYAIIVSKFVEASLYWKRGANVSVTLAADNCVTVECRAKLADGGPIPQTIQWCRPLTVRDDKLIWIGSRHTWRGNDGIQPEAVACRFILWELRDDDDTEHRAQCDEGVCQNASNSAPDLPEQLCLRVAAVIGTESLAIVPGTVEQVERQLRRMGGDPHLEWGDVTLKDARTGDVRNIHIGELGQSSANT